MSGDPKKTSRLGQEKFGPDYHVSSVPKGFFDEPTLRQVTCWARGVLQNKEARDVVTIICNGAWKHQGKYVQAFENYIDLPDRIYVPVRAYARISDEPIESKFVYENEDPELVVLTEETLIKGHKFGDLWKLGDGETAGKVLVVNSARSPEEIAKHMAKDDLAKFKKVVTVDAFSLAEAVVTLDGAEGVYDKSGIGVGISAALVGAIVKNSDIVPKDAAEAETANKEAFKQGYETAKTMDV